MTLAADWQTRVGDMWADEWRHTDRSFSGLCPALDHAIAAAAPSRGRAADLGCGAGVTSIALAALRPDLEIVGVDISTSLVVVAADRAAEHRNVRFLVGAVPDVLASFAPLDLVFSRHGVMFFDDPVRAFAGVAAAMRPGAPLVFSCFRSAAENPWATLIAAPGGGVQTMTGYAPSPFAFADRAFVQDVLQRAGFADVNFSPVDYRYIAGQGDDAIEQALRFFQRIGPAARSLSEAPAEDRAAMISRLRVELAKYLRDDAVEFPAAAWIVSARKPEGNA